MTLSFLFSSTNIDGLKLDSFVKVHDPGGSFSIEIIYEITFERNFFSVGVHRMEGTFEEKIMGAPNFLRYDSSIL